MRRMRNGFTLVEVSLFLAITSILFIGVIVGVQNSIYQQRFNDSVQNFAEFLRSVYGEVTNVQSLGGGRSEKAIYGRLVTFGQQYKQNGEELEEGEESPVFTYSVIGDIGDTGAGSVLQSLSDLNADVVFYEANESGGGKLVPAGISQTYSPKWSASIQKADSYEPFVGALLIVRNPSSGVVYTYALEGETIEVNHLMFTANSAVGGSEGYNILRSSGFLDGSHVPHFERTEVNFCINPYSDDEGALRRNVRIISGSRNASGVEIVPDDESKCVR